MNSFCVTFCFLVFYLFLRQNLALQSRLASNTVIVLPQPPKGWDYSLGPACLASVHCLKISVLSIVFKIDHNHLPMCFPLPLSSCLPNNSITPQQYSFIKHPSQCYVIHLGCAVSHQKSTPTFLYQNSTHFFKAQNRVSLFPMNPSLMATDALYSLSCNDNFNLYHQPDFTHSCIIGIH